MFRYEDVSIREFCEDDISYKIDWINNDKNNQYLHYDLPLTLEKTKAWYEKIKDRQDRWDATILYNGVPVGLTGLLNIDYKNKSAEDYIIIGDTGLKGIGLGTKAGILNFAHAFYDMGLNKLWGTIEVGNEPSLKRAYRLGGHVEGFLHQHTWKINHFVDVYYIGYFKDLFILPDGVFEVKDKAPEHLGGGAE